MNKTLKSILLIISVGIFLFSGYKVVTYFYGTFETNKLNANLISSIKNEKEEGRTLSFSQKYESLLNRNHDMVAWISIEDSNLNYPVMLTPNDEEYYLRRNFDKEYEFRGTLFLNGNANLSERDDNIIIYGHNMDDGTMFGALRKYYNEDYYLKHKIIKFETAYENSDYEIAYVFRTVDEIDHKLYIDYYNVSNFNSSLEFDTQMEIYNKASYYKTDITPKYGDKLITLSTCEYTEDNGRFVIVARKIEK